MKTLLLFLILGTLAWADSITYWADAVNPSGSLDYLVEIGPPPFPGYSSNQIKWIEDSFIFDPVDILACDPFASNCNVVDVFAPEQSVNVYHDPLPQPVSETPEPAAFWLGCLAIPLVVLWILKKSK